MGRVLRQPTLRHHHTCCGTWRWLFGDVDVVFFTWIRSSERGDPRRSCGCGVLLLGLGGVIYRLSMGTPYRYAMPSLNR